MDILIYICNISGDSSKPRAWSKYATDSLHNKVDKVLSDKSKEASIKSLEESNIKSDKNNKKIEKKKKKAEETDNEVKKALEKVQ